MAKKWEDLTISDNFIFSKVMRNKEICQEVLRRILPNLNICNIEIIEYEKVIDPTLLAKGVRLDVYVDDGTRVYIATEPLLLLYCRLKFRSSASSSLAVALATTRLLFLE